MALMSESKTKGPAAEPDPALVQGVPQGVLIHPPDDALIKLLNDSTVYDITDRQPYDARRSGFVQPHRSKRPWGYEDWLARTGEYCFKRLHIDNGAILSIQHHPRKHETLTIESGLCRALAGLQGDLDYRNAKCYRFAPVTALRVETNTVHTFQALEDSVLYEVSLSLPEEEHTVRLRDFYGRS